MPLVAIPSHAASTILVFGDSLSAAYGLSSPERGWVSLLDSRLKAERYPYQVVNASISGETTAGGLSRLKQAIAQHQPSILILELGANDGLRGLPVDAMQQNLTKMLTLAKQNNLKVLLVGMRIPPNYGPQYTQAFHDSFTTLAKQFKVSLVPFLLENVAGKPDLNQDDGLHPTADAQPIILNTIWATLQTLLKKK
ncbi:MAG: arylesterase [Methylophilaceae bacterium 17-44-8]|nr:MAG: arylesterase [Methylophilales bacterium 28-44-11]OZA05998.1 MAG: arylesterase [Methylophilaceae bacterium 17-44-8]